MCDVLEYKTKFLNPSLIQLVNQELEYHTACQTLLAKLGNLEERFRNVSGQETIQRVQYDPYKFIRGRNLFSGVSHLDTETRLMEEKQSLLQEKRNLTADFQYNTNIPLQHYQVGNEFITAESVINKTQGNMPQMGMGTTVIPGMGTNVMPGVGQTEFLSSNIPGQMQTNVIGQVPTTNIISGQTSMFPQTYGYDKNLIYPSEDLLNITNSDEDEVDEPEVRHNLQGLDLNQPITTAGVSNILNTQPLSTGGIESYTNRTLVTPNPINTEYLNIETLEQPLEENISPRFQGQVSPKYKQGFSFQESTVGQGANIQQMPSTNPELKRTDPLLNTNLNPQSKL